MTVIPSVFPAICVLFVLASAVPLPAQESFSLDGFADKSQWAFNNGPEFPGATGAFDLVEEDKKDACAISYDFSGGGAYVNAGVAAGGVGEFNEAVFSVKDRQPGPVMFRIVDATGECFQYKRSYQMAGEWEELRIDVTKAGAESWGGNADKTVDFPLKWLFFGVSKTGSREPTGTLFVSDLKFEKH